MVGSGTDLWVDLLQRTEEAFKGGTAKVGDGAQAREQTPVQHLLEVPLTDVLGEEAEEEGHSQQTRSASRPEAGPPTHLGHPGLPCPPTEPLLGWP